MSTSNPIQPAIGAGEAQEVNNIASLAMAEGAQPASGEAAASESAAAAAVLEPSVEALESIGSGWAAEEALAIGLYCALAHPRDFVAGVCLAANHSGNSPATAAITGNLLGTTLGRDAIPASWLVHLELREQLEEMASDLVTGFSEEDEWFQRYPEF